MSKLSAPQSVGLVVGLGLLTAVAAAPQPFVVTRDGRPVATIVLARQADPLVEFAVGELRDHVQRITGARLAVKRDDEPVDGPRILVGASAATQALGIRPGELRSQEYVIRYGPQTLALVGRPDAGPGGSRRPASGEGRFGRGLALDGRQDAVVVDDPGFDDAQGTLEAWVWLPAEKPATHGTILRLDGADPWSYHIIQRDAQSSAISYTTYDGQNGHGLRTADLPTGWHHVVGTWSVASGQQSLWVDGRLVGTTTYVKTTCHGAALGIGSLASAGGNFLRGRVDEVRVSKVVRDVARDAAGGPYTADEATSSLYHFDEASGPPVDSRSGLSHVAPPSLFGENGTLYAVYDFLERSCDVRWYAPGDLGLVCPSRPTLTVAAADRRHRPAMIHRWITPTPLYSPGPPQRIPAADVNLWKLRMRIGGQNFWVCHSFYGYYDRFLKTHPAWFAQGYSGQPPQMCYTNPEFIAQVVQDARDYFDGKGKQPGATAEGDVFGLVPMDNNSWCHCPRCQAALNAAEKDNQQFNNGKASNYIFAFVNQVAREVHKTHPTKWIGALAYSDYAYYPTTGHVEPNVVMQLCLHTRNWWCPSMEVNDRKVLAAWRAQDPQRPLYLWLYYCFPALNAKSGDFHYWPGYFAHSVVKQMALYRQEGITGIFMEHSSECGESYLMDQLEFYVTLRLADDPTLDGNKLIDEFFTRYYGAAGPPMKQLYERIEDLFGNPRHYPEAIRRSPGHQHQTAALAWDSLGTPERLADLTKLVKAAQAAARTPAEQARVATFAAGQWQYVLDGRRAYDVAKQRRGQAPPRTMVPRLAAAGGDPAKVEWAKVAPLPGWSGLSGAPTDRRLTTQVVHDGTWLYLRLTEQLDPRSLVTGGQLWDGDDFEVFVAAAREGAYRQLAVAPNGRHLELAYKAATDKWDSGVVVRSETTAADRWTVLVAAPLAKLLPGGVAAGGRFYANFYRASPGASNLLAWSPGFGGGFHDLTYLPEWVLAP